MNNLSNNELSVLRNAYKSVFSGTNGEIVLLDLLDRLYFLKPCENDEQLGRNNAAKEIINLVCSEEITEDGSMRKCMNIIKSYYSKSTAETKKVGVIERVINIFKRRK